MQLDGRAVATTDPRGRLKVPGIHDARLDALSVDFGRTLSFDAAAADGRTTSLILDALYMLNIGNFREGVIVDSISLWRVTERLGRSLDAASARAWAALLAGRVPEGEEVAEIERLRRKHHRLTLVEVSRSYGGGLEALCRGVSVDGREITAG